jgi:zinc protease
MSSHLSGLPQRGAGLLAVVGLALTAMPLIAADSAAPVVPATAPAAAAPTSPDPSLALAAASFQIPFEKYTLDNGLEVILHQDPSLPKVAVNLWYHVGPANEPKGRSGFAHLFEHLMFEGSKHAGHQFATLLESVGGTNMNGTTSFDRTNYFETVPSEELELALWLESDRMGFMIDTMTDERLEVQRGVVLNERRQSYENRPYGPSELAMYDRFFQPGHPYHGNVIGSIDDLNRAGMSDVKAFFEAYYAPSNATLALVGDIQPERAKELVQRYFGSLSKRPRPERRKLTTPPLSKAERLVVEEDVSLAKVTLGWIVPPAFSPEEPAIELATQVLGEGKASRLYQQLVVQGLATSVDVWLDDNELASMVGIEAMVASSVPIERVEAALAAALRELAATGPTDAELARAKKGVFVNLASSLQLLNSGGGDGGRAGVLQKLNHYLGDPGQLPNQMQLMAHVAPGDVQAAVQTHLSLDKSLSVITKPKPKPEAAPAGGKP